MAIGYECLLGRQCVAAQWRTETSHSPAPGMACVGCTWQWPRRGGGRCVLLLARCSVRVRECGVQEVPNCRLTGHGSEGERRRGPG